MDREELLRRYAAGERDFAGVILQHISLHGIQLEEVDFTGAIFNAVSFKTTLIRIDDISQGFNEPIFINCNFSCSEWWFCRIPRELIGCNFRYAIMEGCYFHGKFVDCDFRASQIKGACFDDVIFERCDLREMRLSKGIALEPEDPSIHTYFGLLYRNTFDENGVFHSGIHSTIPARNLDDPIPF